MCIEDRASVKRDGYHRIIDESGEDYLYPESYFVPLDLLGKAKTAPGVKNGVGGR